MIFNFGDILSVCMSFSMYVHVRRELSKVLTYIGSTYLHIRFISTEHGSSSQWRSSGQDHSSKKGTDACSCINQLPSTIFIAILARQRRGWPGLRL